jgi:23S rRNA (adenine-N6)-dimethyltransferase
VTAVELDDWLYNRLLSSLATAENLDLHHQDFMEWPLPKTGEYKVFSNIPFSRTTDIVKKLTEHCNPPLEAWLVLEKGAAKRFMGKPRETLRSLLLKPYFELEIAYHFRREDFHPLPSVDIVLLHMIKKGQPDVDVAERAAYARFVAAGMNQGLRALSGFMPKELFHSAVHKTGLGVCAAPGDILYMQWLCLYRCGKERLSGTVKNKAKAFLHSARSMKGGTKTSASKP